MSVRPDSPTSRASHAASCPPARVAAVALAMASTLSSQAEAQPASPPLSCQSKSTPAEWLACQLDGSPDLDPGPGSARLVNSREGGPWDGRAWLFDQTQAAIAFTVAGDAERARAVFSALQILQEASGSPNDGSWCNSYDLSGWCTDSNRPSGSIAWVVVAINYFEWVEKDPTFSGVAADALSYLESLTNDDAESDDLGAVAFSPGRPSEYAAEHQIDAYAAWSGRHLLRGGRHLARAEAIRSFLLGSMANASCSTSGGWKVWLGGWQSIFNAGGACAPLEYYSDPQMWGPLALGAPRIGEIDYVDALDSIWSGGAVDMTVTDVYVRPAAYTEGPDGVSVNGLDLGAFGTATGKVYFIGEASAGYEAASRLYGDAARADILADEVERVLYPDGGVPYSTDPTNDTHKAVASTAWYLFNSSTPPVNPLDPLTYEVATSLVVSKGAGGSACLEWSPVSTSTGIRYDVFRGDTPVTLDVHATITEGEDWCDEATAPAPGEAVFYGVSLRRW